MQSNTDDNLYRELEDSGWSKIRQQLDIELPQKRKKNRGLIWFLFFGLALVTGYQYISLKGPQDTIQHNGNDIQQEIESRISPTLEVEKAKENYMETPTDNGVAKITNIPSDVDLLNAGSKSSTSLVNKLNRDQPAVLATTEKYKAKESSNSTSKTDPATSGNKTSNIIPFDQTSKKVAKVEFSDLETKKQDSKYINTDEKTNIVQHLTPAPELSNNMAYRPDRVIHAISSLYNGIALISYSDFRYSKTFEELKLNQSTTSISPIVVSNDKVSNKRSGFFAETSIDYFLPNTVKNPDYFASSVNIGFRKKISNSFFVTTQAGIVYPYSNSKLFLDNQGLLNLSPGNNTAFDASKASGSTADPIIPITGVVLESTRSITGINNGTLYLSNSDQARINNNRSIQYNFKFSLGYYFSKRTFVEAGLDIRDEFENKPVLIAVSSGSNQVNSINQYKITNYQLPQSDYAAQFAISGLMSYNLTRHWSLIGKVMSSSFKSNQGILIDFQNAVPQNGINQTPIQTLSVNTVSFSLGARYTF